MKEKKILLTQLKRIGDVLMTTPAVRAVRKAFPDAQIDYLTESASAELFAHNPYIDNLITVKKVGSYIDSLKLGLKFRKTGYDIFIDFYSHPLSASIGFISGADMRVGFNRRGRRFFFTDNIDMPSNKPYSPYHKLALLGSLGVYDDDVSLDFFITEADRAQALMKLESINVKNTDTLVTMSPVSRREYKVWMPERFAYVADKLIENFGAKVLFISGPGEDHFVEAVRSYMKNNALPDIKFNSLIQIRSIFDYSKLHISNDNGPCHFAVAAKIPVITIYGKPSAISWSPADNPLIKAFDINLACKSACTFPKCAKECLSGTSADDVLKAAETFLRK